MVRRLLALMLLASLVLSACVAPVAPAAPAGEAAATAAPAAEGEAAPAGGTTYVLVPKNLGNPYFDAANTGAQEAAAELGVTVNYQGSSTADPTEQIQLINSLIAQGVNGLAISANDSDALAPTGKEAMDAGIPVVSWDAAIAEGGRNIHINQADASGIALAQVQMASDLAGGEGEIAILSATSTAPNQNEWIALMEGFLGTDEFSGLTLVATVYGDDDDEKSYTEAQGLMQTYPDLKVIIAPTTVGIAASARAVTDAGKIGQVMVTGLGTPNQMREYVKNGASPAFALWSPVDLGYLAIQTVHALATGAITGAAGDTFTAGRLGDYEVTEGGFVLLGPPTVFNADNVDDFDF